MAAVLFCALASAIYLINDLADLEKDRAHPIKRHRAIASGRVPPRLAQMIAAGMLVLALPLSFAINTGFGLLAAAYVALTIAYTFWLKHIVINRRVRPGSGLLPSRVVAGAVAISVPISPWALRLHGISSLFIGFSKRRHDWYCSRAMPRTTADPTRVPPELLDQIISVITPALVMAYSLYTFSAPNLPENQAMMVTIPFALYGVFRYLYLMHKRDAGGSPEEVLLQDRRCWPAQWCGC
jgi:4-hydroxybenzoate polyprenyltransferase